RRFRLAHVKFGMKVIEVATFRRQVAPGEEVVQDGVPAPVHHEAPQPGDVIPEALDDHLIHHDNTFGTPEEDAFRRDFTINALFYDIASFSIIDYVGGLDDVRAGIVRSIGDPDVRVREDPVRMMRAVALALFGI
ncbi:MAG: poly(A) polymerase, partial [Chloroflexota bacterium]